jgi:hypothetical protein
MAAHQSAKLPWPLPSASGASCEAWECVRSRNEAQLIGAYNELIKAHNELFDAFDRANEGA